MSSGFDKFFMLILCAVLVWVLVRYIKREPKTFSKENLGKSFYTMGLLALGLIVFVAFGVFVLNI